MENRNAVILKWSVGILVVLNIVLLITFWQRPNPMPILPHQPMPAQGPAGILERDLDLDEDQRRQFEGLRAEHQNAMRQFQEDGRKLRDLYFNLLKENQIDSVQKSDLENKISENQKQIEKVTFEHFQKLKGICTDKQREVFNKIIIDVIRNMKGRAPLPPSSHPHGPPPHEDGLFPEKAP